ncbi:MAG: hypothetical protein J1F01_06775 [Oscillospiraceae bacterium]|nr:hypothetical protein [Oscillospiraceae bacterium]
MIKSKSNNRPHAKKLKTIALSIFLAVVVWFMVMSLTDPDITTTISNLPVRFTGESALREKALAVTGRSSIPPLSIVITGKRSDLMSNIDGIYVQVDLSEINAEGEYNMEGTVSVPGNRIKVEKEKYGDIPVKIEPLAAKEIAVSIKQSGSLKDKLVESVVTSPKITIMGAESEIDKVSGAVATVDISEMDTDNVIEAPYLLTDESGALINENETLESARSNVEITNTIYDTATLPVRIELSEELRGAYILKANSSTVTPATVTVGVKEGVSVESVAARINKPDVGDGDEYALVAVPGVYIPPENRMVKAKADIARKESIQLELPVRLDNVPDGLSASAEGNVVIIVSGEAGMVNNETVTASVDLAGLSKGTHTLPVVISGENVSAEGYYTVNVNIE